MLPAKNDAVSWACTVTTEGVVTPAAVTPRGEGGAGGSSGSGLRDVQIARRDNVGGIVRADEIPGGRRHVHGVARGVVGVDVIGHGGRRMVARHAGQRERRGEGGERDGRADVEGGRRTQS